MRDEGASGELRVGEWVPAPRRESPTFAPRDEPAPAIPHGALPAPAPHREPSPVVRHTEPVPAVPGWAASEETVALPAFLRGLAAPGALAAATDPTAPLATLPAPVSTQPMTSTGRHTAVPDAHPGDYPLPGPATTADADPAGDSDGGNRLPSSERNMLIFVSSLLAAGTLAIVAMGHGALEKSSGSPATISGAPSASASPAPSFVGSPDVRGYCDRLDGHLTSSPPGAGHATWSCTGIGHVTVTFTPTDVCRAQYGPSARAVYTALSDTRTWRCLR